MWELTRCKLMAPIPRPALPYTISSPEWNIFSEAVKALEGAIDDDASDWLHSVLSVFSKVYTVAKIIVTIFRYYGIEVRDRPCARPSIWLPSVAGFELTATIGGRHP